ncbi:MAG: hypothetical protein KME25_09885 [Symplocastrum torsivum CPER-KK1]|jgi:hypothetical protein|uniref:Uncharacterized protein n=1 Tax=Symplocastrum torsivum CPER-KK1 TaxID=450513 RepID=A0A951PKU8_9CYAN|nr:hypothetical protein [Symplocastrum torsivum CPER-KK1]
MSNTENQNLNLAATASEKVMLVPVNSTESSANIYQTLLVNGGVTILAIFALTYFTRSQIDAITKLLKAWKK